jgi:hypothetical protein
LFSAATVELPKNPNYHGDPKKRPTQAKWTHDGQCETLPYYKERTAREDSYPREGGLKPKWKLTTYEMESDQCKKICEPGKQKHCCIATCDLFDRKGNTCKLSKLAPEWYLSSAALEADENYKRFKGWRKGWRCSRGSQGRQGAPSFSKRCYCYTDDWRTQITSAKATSDQIKGLFEDGEAIKY